MYYLRSGTRMLQSRQNIRNSTFTLYNTQLTEHAEIGPFAAWLLRRAHKGHSFERLLNNHATAGFLNQFVDMGFICKSNSDTDIDGIVYLGNPFRHRLPLTALNIELTNMCNLNCQHCYGAFSNTIKPEFVSFDWIKHSLGDFNKLHVRKIALTGGEATIHPQFLDISLFLIKNGFDVCVFTNGYNCRIIKELLEQCKEYHLTIKVSLDGLGDTHNQIRGKQNAYSRVIETLETISKYPNVTLYISTSVLRQNIDEIAALDRFLINKFPNAIHTKDLAFPLGNANDCAFTIDELTVVDKKIPELFVSRRTSETKETSRAVTPVRCTGGVSQCTVMPDGNLKICNAACDKQFYFKHNAYSKGLKYAWFHCGKAINKYRHEKPRNTAECKKCNLQERCMGSNCRVLSWVYTGNVNGSNPLTCYSTHKMMLEEEK